MNVVFWICGPFMVIGGLGLILFRKAVYSAMSMAFAMINLAALYASLDAPFLFAIQIIVYTGAILMLFLFVLMLVGVDTPDSIVETIKGQRILSALGALGLLGLMIFSVGGAITGPSDTMEGATVAAGGNVQGVATTALRPVRVGVRTHLGAAGHGGGRRHDPRPRPAHHTQARPA